uniref:Chitin-binding type-2 domain-containing protein n=1 Tax=Anopheles minimus TaxID=112268 RepID=A0A182W3V9_9DIPT
MASDMKIIFGVAFVLLGALACLSNIAQAARCDGLPGGTMLLADNIAECNRYVVCQHEIDHEWYCPPGEFFNPRNLQCELSCPPERERLWCAGVPDGAFIRVPPGQPPNCQNYYTCFGGEMFLNSCPPGFFFSQVLQACGLDQQQC